MSAVLLNNGVFEEIGDSTTLKLEPITMVVAFNTFTDTVENVTASRLFTKEFRYKKNSAAFTSWAPLTNANLATITTVSTDVFLFEVRYTRSGADATGVLKLNCFELNSIQVTACYVLRINKNSYDTLYGTGKYFEILSKIAEFNKDMTERGLQLVFPVVDNTITEKSGMDIKLEPRACATDMNEVLKTLFGNYLTDKLSSIEVDTYDGIRS